MNTKPTLALAAFAVASFASFAVHADEYNGGERALQFKGDRTRAEVMAEAVVEAHTHSTIPSGSKVAQPSVGTVQTHVVRQQAIDALRLGQISSGEAGHI